MVHRPKCGISDPKVWTQPPLRNSYQLLNKKVRGLEKQRDLGAVLIQEKIRNLGAVLVPENRVLDQLIQRAIQDLGLQGLHPKSPNLQETSQGDLEGQEGHIHGILQDPEDHLLRSRLDTGDDMLLESQESQILKGGGINPHLQCRP